MNSNENYLFHLDPNLKLVKNQFFATLVNCFNFLKPFWKALKRSIFEPYLASSSRWVRLSLLPFVIWHSKMLKSNFYCKELGIYRPIDFRLNQNDKVLPSFNMIHRVIIRVLASITVWFSVDLKDIWNIKSNYCQKYQQIRNKNLNNGRFQGLTNWKID